LDEDDDENAPVSSASARRAFSSASRRAVYSDKPMRFDFIAPSEIGKQSDNKQQHNKTITLMSVNDWINYDNYVHITQPDAKNVPNWDVLFANGELHQAYGHVTLTMSAQWTHQY